MRGERTIRPPLRQGYAQPSRRDLKQMDVMQQSPDGAKRANVRRKAKKEMQCERQQGEETQAMQKLPVVRSDMWSCSFCLPLAGRQPAA